MKRSNKGVISLALLLMGVICLTTWQSGEEPKTAIIKSDNPSQAPRAIVAPIASEIPTEPREERQADDLVTAREPVVAGEVISIANRAQISGGILDVTPETAREELPAYVSRARQVSLNVAGLPTKTTEPGARVCLNLFAEKALTVQWLSKDIHAEDNYAWNGRVLEDPLSAVTLTRVGDYTIIDVQSPRHGNYEVRAQDGGPGEVRQFDSERINRGCKTSLIVAGFGGDPLSQPTSDEEATSGVIAEAVVPVTIDVLMVYTPKARDAAGGRSSIVAKAQAAVNGENSNFSRSGVSHRMRLVQAREVGHTASGNLATELGWVAGNSTVASIRNDVGADVVAFLSDRDDAGMYGIAYQLTSTGGNSGQVFSANYYDTVSGVWPHEVGHNLGCQHNDPGVYSYSSGHYWKSSSNGNQYGSIMSYIGQRVPYFSNPEVSASGGDTGTSTRNNALSINNIGDNVASYRGAKTLVEPSCVLTTSTVKPNEGVNFTITIKTVNGGPSSATACQIAVTLPSRLTLVSHNGGAAFNPTTKVWDVPDLADNASASLVLTVRANAGSTGISQTPSAKISSIGSGVVDFNIYNNESSVTLVPVPVPTSDLILHYTLNETSGKTAADASANDGTQNAVTSYATPLWQPTGGMIGGALRFTPTTQSDVAQTFSYNSSLPIVSNYPFTVALWMRAMPGTWYQVCAMLGKADADYSYFELSTNAGRGRAMARNTTSVNVGAVSPEGVPVADGEWHHIAGVFPSAATRIFYVDGVAVASNSTSVSFVTDNKRFSIGALMRLSPTDAFSGSLDDIGLWNTALSPARIALIHALGRHSRVDLADPAIDTLLSVSSSTSGFARAGDLVWIPATGLAGAIGATGMRNGQPYLVLNSTGGGIIAQSEPALTLQQPSSDTISLSWHSGFSDWILQESNDLSTTGWIDSTEPVTDDGSLRSIDYSTSETEQRFFRLRKP